MSKRDTRDSSEIDKFIKEQEERIRDLIHKVQIEAKREADETHIDTINTLKAEKLSIHEQLKKENDILIAKVESLTKSGAILQEKLRSILGQKQQDIDSAVNEKIKAIGSQFEAEKEAIKTSYIEQQKAIVEEVKKKFEVQINEYQQSVNTTFTKMESEILTLREKNKLLENGKDKKEANPNNFSEDIQKMKNEIEQKNAVIMKLQEILRKNQPNQSQPNAEIDALKGEIGQIVTLYQRDKDYKNALVIIDETKPIAEGGNGIIYRGTIAGSECVGKKAKIMDDQTMKEILNEVTLSLKYPHPNLIQLYGMLPNGIIVMEKLEFTLEKVITILAGNSNTVNPNILVNPSSNLTTSDINKIFMPLLNRFRIIYDILCGIEHMHAMNVVNADIKPSNVMFDKNFKAKLIDFGLAKQKKSESANTVNATLTSGAAFGGTLPYMAPEQFESDKIPYTKATDIFALGITILSIMILEKPYDGLSSNSSNLFAAMKYRIMNPVPSEEKIRKISDDIVQNIVRKSLALKPEQRPNANELRVTMGNYLSRLK